MYLFLIDGKIDLKVTAEFSILSIDSAEKLDSASFTPYIFTEGQGRGFLNFTTIGDLKQFKNAISCEQINVRVAISCEPAGDEDADQNPYTPDDVVANLSFNVQLKTSDGETVCANDKILADKSNILQDQRDVVQHGELEQITVDFTHPVMTTLIRYMNHVSVDADVVSKNFFAIIEAADKFNVYGIAARCAKVIQKRLDNDIVLKVAAIAYDRGFDDLFEKCCKHIGVWVNFILNTHDSRWLTFQLIDIKYSFISYIFLFQLR